MLGLVIHSILFGISLDDLRDSNDQVMGFLEEGL